ncbi:MAG TPA: hypothetical protein VFT93_04700 [Candidatus Eisenbacteria bacterium]|jgi:hypothetical protein|nr:hypothetical protein [Candidatus Eisenbacteria bacterium]
MRTAALPARTAAMLLLAGSAAAGPSLCRAEAPPPPPPPVSTPILAPDSRAETHPAGPTATPLQLFAAAEEAWGLGDAEALASLVDTTQVRIGLKPGSTPTAAMTRSAAAFLFQDQLRLVTTKSFQVSRVNVGNASATATARWWGDWGGREGVRKLTVTLSAVPLAGRWYLREVRVKG